MNIVAQMVSCTNDLQVTLTGSPGDYVVAINAFSQNVTLSAPDGVSTGTQIVTFTSFPFITGTTYTGTVSTVNNAGCTFPFTVSIPDCVPVFETNCEVDGTKTITYISGCENLFTMSITAGPGTVVGSSIIGADATTTFDLITQEGCVFTGFTAADGTDVTACTNYEECLFFHDFGITVSTATAEQWSLTSLLINGAEQISSPIELPAPNVIAIGAETYNTAFADLINAAGVEELQAITPTEPQIVASQALAPSANLRNAIFRLRYPDCITFQITMSTFDEDFVMDETGIISTINPAYKQAAKSDCTSSVICI